MVTHLSHRIPLWVNTGVEQLFVPLHSADDVRSARADQRHVDQGSAIQRPSTLDLTVDDEGTIFVTGIVREISRGTFTI